MELADLIDSPDKQVFWQNLASTHIENQQKLRRERDRMRKLQTQILRQIKEAQAGRREEELGFLTLYQRLVENFLHQFEILQIDADDWALPETSTIAKLEWGVQVTNYLMLQLDQRNLEPLFRILNEDLEAALAGEPAARKYPEAWNKLRPTLAGSPDWVDTLRRFQADYPEFREAVMLAVASFEPLAFLPGADRLREAKEINLPALRGIHYRLVAGFRRLQDGEALLLAVRLYPLDFRDTPDSDSPSKKKSLTDRMLGFLKKN